MSHINNIRYMDFSHVTGEKQALLESNLLERNSAKLYHRDEMAVETPPSAPNLQTQNSIVQFIS